MHIAFFTYFYFTPKTLNNDVKAITFECRITGTKQLSLSGNRRVKNQNITRHSLYRYILTGIE